MVRNLNRLSREEVFQLLSQKVNKKTAQIFWNNEISGANFVVLTGEELMGLQPLVGPKKEIEGIIANFKKYATAQPKVCTVQ